MSTGQSNDGGSSGANKSIASSSRRKGLGGLLSSRPKGDDTSFASSAVSKQTPVARRVSSTLAISARGDPLSKYDDYELAQNLIRYQEKRNASFRDEGKLQVFFPKSTDGWIVTIAIGKGRALDWMLWPFVMMVFHAAIATLVQQFFVDAPASYDVDANDARSKNDLEIRELFFGLVLNSSVAGLLAFRVYRAMGHFWTARAFWGRIIERGRSLVGMLIAHGSHDIVERDGAIRWTAAMVISIMELLRGCSDYPVDHFAGLLTLEEIHELAKHAHPPIYACNRVRDHLKVLYDVDENTPFSVAQDRIRHLDALEDIVNSMLGGCGGLQRIRSTPLPIVCVSHLRTLLLISIILLPYIWGRSWAWRTIPIVAVAAFAWFGIEAVAAEIEVPFDKDRMNALNQDGYCIGFLQTVQQQIVNHANEDIKRKEKEQMMRELSNRAE